MPSSLWDLPAAELLRRTSSPEPTPGGGAIAALAAAFGVGLIAMAVEVSATSVAHARPRARLADARDRLRQLQLQAIAAADRDAGAFDAVIAAYRMPAGAEAERSARRHEITAATAAATREPLDLAEACAAAIALGEEIRPLVAPAIVSDVGAGCDLLRGAAFAALRTADVNLAALEERGSADAPALRDRHAAAAAALEGQWPHG